MVLGGREGRNEDLFDFSQPKLNSNDPHFLAQFRKRKENLFSEIHWGIRKYNNGNYEIIKDY